MARRRPNGAQAGAHRPTRWAATLVLLVAAGMIVGVAARAFAARRIGRSDGHASDRRQAPAPHDAVASADVTDAPDHLAPAPDAAASRVFAPVSPQVAEPDAEAGRAPDDVAPNGPAGDDGPGPAATIDLERIERELAGVEAALRRLDDGTYWTDEVTGDPIDDAVLVADPVARRNP
jgi:hypothetical protein